MQAAETRPPLSPPPRMARGVLTALALHAAAAAVVAWPTGAPPAAPSAMVVELVTLEVPPPPPAPAPEPEPAAAEPVAESVPEPPAEATPPEPPPPAKQVAVAEEVPAKPKPPPPRPKPAVKPAKAPAPTAPAASAPTTPAVANTAPAATPAPPAPAVAAPVAAEPPPVAAMPLEAPRPPYPLAARRRGIEGVVLLAVEVDEDGRPCSVVVKESSGVAMLDQAATEGVKRWRFTPAQRGGRPVTTVVELPVRFTLRDSPA